MNLCVCDARGYETGQAGLSGDVLIQGINRSRHFFFCVLGTFLEKHGHVYASVICYLNIQKFNLP